MQYIQKEANPASFISLPESLVEDIGISVNRGVKLDVVVLSCFAYYYVINSDIETTVRLGSTLIQKPKGVFILTGRRVARNIHYRFFGREADEDSDQFRKLYERVRKSIQRLAKRGLIERQGYVNPSRGPRSGIYWTLKGNAKKIVNYNYRVYLWNQNTISEKTEVNTIADIFRAQSYEDFTKMIYRCGYRRKSFADYMTVISAVSENKMNFSRHRGIGAYEKEWEWADPKSVYIPFFVIDIDSEFLEESYAAFSRAFDSFSLLNLDTSRFIASPTGGEGFHIEIPAGAFGNPVFRNSDTAFKAVKLTISSIMDDEVDYSRFNPNQNIRMIGSEHEQTGRYKIPLRENERNNLQEIVNISSTWRPSRIRHPATARPQPYLIEKITEAMTAKFSFSDVDEYAANEEIGGDTIKRIQQGIEEGEHWHSKHVGRSKAAFILGCYLIRKYGMMELPSSWNELLDWNKKNTPPMTRKDLENSYRSALKRVRRDERVRH